MHKHSLKKVSGIKFTSMCSLPYGTELTILGQVDRTPKRWRVSVSEDPGANEIEVNTEGEITGRFVVIQQAKKHGVGFIGRAVPVAELEEEAAKIEDSILSTLLTSSK